MEKVVSSKKSRNRRKGQIDNDRTEVKPQHTIEKKWKPKIEVLEEYWNFNSFRLVPVTRETIVRLGENGILWAKTTERGYKIQQFLIEQGIALRTWQRWRKEFPELQAASEIMIMILGCRREEGLIERKFEPQSTMFMMHRYDEEWKQAMEWKASLTNKAEATGGTQFVVIPDCPRSPLVPDRKEE